MHYNTSLLVSQCNVPRSGISATSIYNSQHNLYYVRPPLGKNKSQSKYFSTECAASCIEKLVTFQTL